MSNRALRLDGLVRGPELVISRPSDVDGTLPAARPAWASVTRCATWNADQVRKQLDRILASQAFDARPRNRAFLSYVVNETLAGREDRIKGYTIAQEVFQRDADFDPQQDPVVRIEAGNLRRSLERYYLTAGTGDPVVIDIPKGGYVPRFEVREPASDEETTRAVSSLRRRLRLSLVARSDSPADVVSAYRTLIRIEKHILAALWTIALIMIVVLLR